MTRPSLALIAAVARNGVIGHDNRLPWKLPEDMQRFRSLTMGHPVVMGRKTWDSLPRKPLPERTNIVVTRPAEFTAAGALVAPSLEAALTAARGDALRRGVNDIAVIGGSEIFAATLPLTNRI